jgi:membrane protease YdiL (CAAX protease family)
MGAALLQLAAMLAIAFIVNALFGPRPLRAVASDGRSLVWQFSAGIVLAIAFSVPALIAILKLDFFLSFKTLLLALTQRVNLNGWRPLGFGLCAGIGEELLFRGTIQPLLGMLGLVLTQIGLIAAVVLHSVADAVIFFVLRGVARASNGPDLGGSSSVPEGSVSGGQ